MSVFSSATPIRVRLPYEGVGNALRTAYAASGGNYGLPDDLRSLLRQLD